MSTATTTQAQSSKILAHLQTGAGITALEALRLYGCLRLGARIYDLKQLGYKIITTMIKVGKKRVAQYTLVTTETAN
jgi:hypothetical protein